MTTSKRGGKSEREGKERTGQDRKGEEGREGGMCIPVGGCGISDGGEALAVTGDFESPFLVESEGEEPMMGTRIECGGGGVDVML